MPSTRAQKRITEFYAENRAHPNHDTPTKTRICEAVAAFDRHGPTPTTPCKQRIFDRLDVRRGSTWRILNQKDVRTVGSVKKWPKTRGRRFKLITSDLQRVEELIKNYDNTGRRLGWPSLVNEAGLDCTPQTLQQHIGLLD